MRLVPSMNAAVSARLADAGRVFNGQALAGGIHDAKHPARAPGDLRDLAVAEVVKNLVERGRHRRERGEPLDERVARGQRLLREHRVAVLVHHRARHQVPLLVGEGLVELDGEGVREEVEHVLARGEIDGEVVPLRGRNFRDAPFGQRLAGRDELHHRRAPRFEVGLDGADEGRALHAGEQMPEEPLLRALERGIGGGLGVAVERRVPLDDAGGLERRLDVRVDDLERARVGVVDAPLLRRQGMLEDVHLHAVVAQSAGLVEPEGLQVPRDHLHRGDPARLHRGDEVRAGLERGLARAPQAQAPRVRKARHRRGTGRRDVGDARVGKGVLEAKPRAALLRGGDLAAAALRPRRVRHRVRLVEDDDALAGVALGLVETAGEPADDLLQARALALARGRAKGRVGGEEDPLGLRDLRPLADLRERDDVTFRAPERGPVAPGVLEELVGLREPERAPAAPQPLVEDDGRDLAALAAPRAVSEHPALPETDGRRQPLVRIPGAGVDRALVLPVDAAHGLPALADAVEGAEVAVVGLAREHHALQLRVGEEPFGDHALRQHRAVRGPWVRHRGHGAGLHERRRVRHRARDAERPRPPRLEGAGGGDVARLAFEGARLVAELGHRPEVAGLQGLGLGLRCRLGRSLRRARATGGCRRGVEEIGDGAGRDRARAEGEPGRHLRGDRGKQRRGVGDECAGIDRCAGPPFGIAVEHGQARVEARPAPGVRPPVDGDGKGDPCGRVHPLEGAGPGAVARHAVRGGDGREPPARREHRARGAKMVQVRVVAPPGDAGACRERRVHQDHRGPDERQVVGDALRVAAGDGRAREERIEEPGPGGAQLVQVKRPLGLAPERALGEHREHAGPGRGLEHHVARAHRRGLERGVGERQGGGELLHRDLLLGAARVGGLQRGHRFEHREHPRGRTGFPAHRAPVALDEQHHRGLGRLVGVLPGPGAGGVGALERSRHDLAQGARIERAARGEHRRQGLRRGDEPGGLRPGRRHLGGAQSGRDGRLDRRRRLGVEHGEPPERGDGTRRPGAGRGGSPRSTPGSDSGRPAPPPRGGRQGGREGPTKRCPPSRGRTRAGARTRRGRCGRRSRGTRAGGR